MVDETLVEEGDGGGGRPVSGVLVVEGPSVISAPSCPSLGNTWTEEVENPCLPRAASPARTALALKSAALIGKSAKT